MGSRPRFLYLLFDSLADVSFLEDLVFVEVLAFFDFDHFIFFDDIAFFVEDFALLFFVIFFFVVIEESVFVFVGPLSAYAIEPNAANDATRTIKRIFFISKTLQLFSFQFFSGLLLPEFD